MTKNLIIYVVLIVLLLLVLGTGLLVGSFETSLADVQAAILAYEPDNPVHFAIVQLRLPRLLLALLVGSSLSFCGYLMQAMVNNPLADPYILGTASGASLGASLSISGVIATTWGTIYLPPFFALIGAFGVTVLVIALGYRKGQIIPTQLLLAGIAISSLLTALVSFFTFLFGSESNIKSILFWSMGDFGRANWDFLAYPAIALILALLLFRFQVKELNTLLLGSERAHALGVHVVRTRWLILITVAVLCGFSVALAGSVGFVGIIIPHVTRALMGITYKNNLLVCAWLGGVFMIACDILSRFIYPPAGLPIGIITSFFGVPFFVYLLLKKQYHFN
ncbi:FecCD family ABC transporter permease [Adhaeribacter radiodurans]|uniref:Iron ABC transporter permease n=1 Tax=Adhaeribacter radiodurans TaxID=2745197 RepID=A0A7L7LC01_9BACT|nr:iron ABC transporter permease [Adhaeribacter radiodurans]QMU30370.1 iron ABC transporter permease [Adhaeribacter radiodurans]